MNSLRVVLLSVLFVQPSFAQVLEPLPSHPTQLDPAWWSARLPIEPDDANRDDLAQWIEEYADWQEWAARHFNKRQWMLHPFPYPYWKNNPSLFSYVAPPRLQPAPPVWLHDACEGWASSTVADHELAAGCRLLTISQLDDPAERIGSRIAIAPPPPEKTPNLQLFEHIHFASLWTDLQPNGPGAFGLAGVHATIDLYGRWQIYPFPGLMAVSVRNLEGKRIVTIGYDWGMAVRLFDMRIPYFNVPARAHLNITEVWVPEAGQKVEMIGLSFSLKKNP
jgi:hypothetical protein